MAANVHLRRQLEARLSEILGRIGRIDQDLRKTPELDWAEQAAAIENDQVLEGLDDLGRAEAIAIRRTLRRMDAGEYGFCAGCREPIDQKRLAAVPTADRCIFCES